MGVQVSSLGCACGLGAVGDWRDGVDTFFTLLMTSGGVSGNRLRAALTNLVPMAQAASDATKHPFMFEVEKRPELQTDAAVPVWLLEQIGERVKAMLASTKSPASALAILDVHKAALSQKTARDGAPAAKPGQTKPVDAKGRPKRALRTWLVVSAGVGVALIGGVLIYNLTRRRAPATAVAGLGRAWRRRR